MNAPSRFPSLTGRVAPQSLSPPSIGFLTNYPPTLCGTAHFAVGLADQLSAKGSDVGVIRIADGGEPSSRAVVGELVNGSSSSVAACIDLLNRRDVAIVHHDDGSAVANVLDGLRVPTIVIVHDVPKTPTAQQRSVMDAITSCADRIVVQTVAASERLHHEYAVDRRRIAVIGRGATLPTVAPLKRAGRPTLLTWGLLRQGKGIERVIDAMSTLGDLRGQPRYLVAGQTHPSAFASEGDAYRDACIARARDLGVSSSVVFDPVHRSSAALSAMIQSSAVVVLPYDSTDQVSSGVLVDAIAAGRPVVATAFPHAVELLGSGAGVVVEHDDQDGLTLALRRMLTDPRLTGDMAAEARRLAPTMAWKVAAAAYLALASRVLAERSALV